MNYLKLIIRFWKLRRSKRITSVQADLYYFLLQECNERDWENPFECSNTSICAAITVSDKTLADARNRLKQYGLIDFKAGIRNTASPVYELMDDKSIRNNSGRTPDERWDERGDETGMKGVPINRNKQNKTKQNKTSVPDGTGAAAASASESSQPDRSEQPAGDKEKSSAKKERSSRARPDATPHWAALVAEWHRFYRLTFRADPTFSDVDASALKKLIGKIKLRVEDFPATSGQAWTEGFAVDWLQKFLIRAAEDKWLRDNYLLPNLNSKFDSIVNRHEKSGSNNASGVLNADLKQELAADLERITGQARQPAG